MIEENVLQVLKHHITQVQFSSKLILR